MYRTTIDFHDRTMRGQPPVVYLQVSTDLGERVYAKKELGQLFETGPAPANGSFKADGSVKAGAGDWTLEKAARVLSWGRFDRTIRPQSDGLLLGLTKKQQQHLSIVLDNADRHFSKLLPKEPFLSKSVTIYAGFEDLAKSEHLALFTGKISEVEIGVGARDIILEIDER